MAASVHSSALVPRGAARWYQPLRSIGQRQHAAAEPHPVQQTSFEVDAGELQRENEALRAQVKALQKRIRTQQGETAPTPRRSAPPPARPTKTDDVSPPPYTLLELYGRWALRKSTPGQPMPVHAFLMFTWPGKLITVVSCLAFATLMVSAGFIPYLPVLYALLNLLF